MGVSNSEMLLSEKDLSSMEFNFLVRPALKFEDECDIAPLQISSDPDDLPEEDEEEEVQEHQEDKCKLLISTLKIKLPSLGEFKIQEQEQEQQDLDDGCKTPTSLNHKIPTLLPCPPAPRKPKSLPSNKRKSPARRRVLLDLSNEIESLFPPALRADLGAKIKKVRQENDTKCEGTN
ncbi:conserved hypothetical protein [Ricinus communis]|uniref:Cyclin-dependent protein kinase inhibitor SMR3-like n=2 Tax=Ricinus communis TaxID=3988 RepID=B9T5R7_RICCO|nr:conserved hypothetical protein [Ricinus communis]